MATNPITLALALAVYTAVALVLGTLAARVTKGVGRIVGYALVGGWALAVWALIVRGALPANELVSPLVFAMFTPVLVGLVLVELPPLRALIRALPLPPLVAVQTYRVFGGLFLLGVFNGTVPPLFGVLTGVWDIAIGLSAPFVARALAARDGRRAAVTWNVLGLLDFAVSISLNVLATIGILRLSPGPAFIGTEPYVFIAAFGVPLSILLHTFALVKLRGWAT